MKNKFTKNNFRIFVGMAFTLFFLSSAFFVQAQQLIDSLNWSTGYRNALVATGQNSLYIGGLSSIGKARGPQAFFLNGSTEPDAGMPFFTDERQINSRNVYAFVEDGSGGWYVGGDFISVNGEKTGPLVHIRSDKSLEVPFVNNLSFSSYYSWPYVWVIKKSGGFLYVGGDFSATDGTGNKYRSLFRVNLATKTVDASFNPFSSFSGDTTLNSALVKEIEITGDKVFVSGQFDFKKPYATENTLVFNLNTGKVLRFYEGIDHIKLLGDTLLFIHKTYGSVGLPLDWETHGGNTVVLDTLVDSVGQKVLKYSSFVYSVPDGRGGWFVAGAPGWNKKQGIFHLDRNLQIDTAFKQFDIPTDYWGNLIGLSQMTVAGNSLFVAFNGTINVDGVKLSGLLKLDTATGNIDKSFHPNPSNGNSFWKVYSLAAKGDTLFVAGYFDSIAGQKQPNLAAVRASTGAFIGWYPSVQPLNSWDGSIRQMKIINDTLYAAGDFKVPGTPEIDYLARFDLKTGSVDTAFHAFTGKYMHITGMVVCANKVFVSGSFDLNVDGRKSSNLAYVDLNDKTV
ncbi:MAG TPA: hypothetical protein ENJ69_01180, partial [Bacteroidetes bacterium]|nr:hypothetical protein [Bacteroidota bacterium]